MLNPMSFKNPRKGKTGRDGMEFFLWPPAAVQKQRSHVVGVRKLRQKKQLHYGNFRVIFKQDTRTDDELGSLSDPRSIVHWTTNALVNGSSTTKY